MADDLDVTGAWRSFCARLADVGSSLEGEPFPQSDAGRALGTRHLARQLVMALQAELEHADASNPTFHRYEEPWVQWGGPNPDNAYTRAPIDPAATYRVFGHVAGVRAAIFSFVDGDMHLGRYGVFSERSLADLDVDADGSLELWISPEPHDHNWIESHADAHLFLVRQYLCDWEHDRGAPLTIERVDTRGIPSPPPAARDLVAALDRAATWVERSTAYWCTYVERARDSLPCNAVAPPGTPRGGAPTIAYGAGWWQLEADEVLVITTDVPDAGYWGWTVHHRYRLDSGDFANRQTSLNLAQAFVDHDGRIRLVLAHRDPGVPNWIDTEGQPEGMLVYRSVDTRSRPVPQSVVVSFAAVREHVPASHPVVGAADRRNQLARRRAAVLARYL
ncbi:MAG: hypothetical protein JWM72_3733 [Actinomycetia bacterium]|nr:hypothetical protein [Actinomycetes bacterium]